MFHKEAAPEEENHLRWFSGLHTHVNLHTLHGTYTHVHVYKHTYTHDARRLSDYMLNADTLLQCWMLSMHFACGHPKHFSSTLLLPAKDPETEKDVICPEGHSQHQQQTAQLSAQIITTTDRQILVVNWEGGQGPSEPQAKKGRELHILKKK